MTISSVVKISKQLSYWLRHCPDDAGLTLSKEGWANVDDVLQALARKDHACDITRLEEVVASNDKKRFEFSEDGTLIRARQGHSVAVDLKLVPLAPPDVLFHGTAERFLEPILTDGLKAMNRHHVHLSQDRATAYKVGARHGRPVVLVIDAAAMHEAGHVFFRTDNGVWLTDKVPAKYLVKE